MAAALVVNFDKWLAENVKRKPAVSLNASTVPPHLKPQVS